MKQQTQTPDTTKQKELHTQEHEFWLRLNEGEADEQVMTLGQYIAAFDEAEDGVTDDIMPVLNLGQDEAVQFGADFIRRISTPPNERKALLDSHSELLEAVSGLYNEISPRDYPKHSGMTIVWLDKVKTAINNAKKH